MRLHPLATIATYLGCWGMVFILAVREVALDRNSRKLDRALGLRQLVARNLRPLGCPRRDNAQVASPSFMDRPRHHGGRRHWPLGILQHWAGDATVAIGRAYAFGRPAGQRATSLLGHVVRRRLFPELQDGLLGRFGNMAMYAGVKFVNGYACFTRPLVAKLLPMEWSGFMTPDQVATLLPREAGPGGLLQMMGVDGIVLGKDYAGYTRSLEDLGWKVVARTKRRDALLHWPGPPRPIARAMTKVEWVKNADQIIEWDPIARQ